MESISTIQRYLRKRRISKLVRQLPGDMQPALLSQLIEIIDLPDRMEKVRRTREIFVSAKGQINEPYRQKVEDCSQEYEDRIKRAASNILLPDLPIPRLAINHALLEEKAKAQLTLGSLEEEIMTLPHTNRFHMFAGMLGVLLSSVANFMTVTAKLGSDWIGGNETASILCNAFISLTMCILEAAGFYLFMSFMPKRLANGFSRILGMVGAVIVVVSICIAIFSRIEVGPSSITNPQDSGKVE